jgi:methylmalonyl-CoA mutase cobalamin-binding subunit
MAPDHQPARRLRDGPEQDFVVRPIPFLVGLWRQLGADPVPKRTPSEEPELFAALQTEIIPRLMIANQLSESPPKAASGSLESRGTAFDLSDRTTFLVALLSDDSELAAKIIEGHLGRGHELSNVLIELCAWAAREMGEMWTDDRVSFVDVTIGVCRLHDVVHRFSGSAETAHAPVVGAAPSILIASAPGEQHVFGVLVASELFRQQGWDVTTETSGDANAIVRQVSTRRFDLAGLSVSHDGAVGDLTDLVSAMRTSAKNPSMKMLAGGQLFQHSPHIAEQIGADGIAGSGLDAPELARKLLARSQPDC